MAIFEMGKEDVGCYLDIPYSMCNSRPLIFFVRPFILTIVLLISSGLAFQTNELEPEPVLFDSVLLYELGENPPSKGFGFVLNKGINNF